MSKSQKETQLVEAAQELRNLAKLTAKHLQNWDSFEAITFSMLSEAYDAGVSQSSAEPPSSDKKAEVLTGPELHAQHMAKLKEKEFPPNPSLINMGRQTSAGS